MFVVTWLQLWMPGKRAHVRSACMQKIQDDEAREVEQSGLADKDAFAELKALAGEGGTMAHGEGLPSPPTPKDDPKVCKPVARHCRFTQAICPHLQLSEMTFCSLLLWVNAAVPYAQSCKGDSWQMFSRAACCVAVDTTAHRENQSLSADFPCCAQGLPGNCTGHDGVVTLPRAKLC